MTDQGQKTCTTDKGGCSEPLYIRFRPLAEGEKVARTVDYNDKGQVMIDLDANDGIIGVEILFYTEVEVDGLAIYNMKTVLSLVTALKGIGKELPVKEQTDA